MANTLQQRLHDYINNPNDSDANFNLAVEYERIGQTGAALAWYLRAAEKSHNDLQQYEAIVHCALCLERQKTRDDSTKVLLLKAIALLPRRPEAYFLLARLHERGKIWQDSYTMAELGLQFCDFDLPPLSTDVEYPGRYGLIFEKGVSAWWIAFCDESREIMVDLQANYEMTPMFATAVERNLATIGYPYKISPYFQSQQDQIRLPFNGLDQIEKNYSQTYQDLFVLAMHNGKRSGTYLEIGCAEPFKNNNTALLETEFEWTGASIDINREVVEQFTDQRENLVFCLDATKIDYAKFIKKVGLPADIDYLQVDCEPPSRTFEILKMMPFDTHRFAVITFEHDYYADKSVRDASREFLTAKGYRLIASDIAFNAANSYEDWWVHPELISSEIQEQMIDISEGAKYARDYLFPKK